LQLVTHDQDCNANGIGDSDSDRDRQGSSVRLRARERRASCAATPFEIDTPSRAFRRKGSGLLRTTGQLRSGSSRGLKRCCRPVLRAGVRDFATVDPPDSAVSLKDPLGFRRVCLKTCAVVVTGFRTLPRLSAPPSLAGLSDRIRIPKRCGSRFVFNPRPDFSRAVQQGFAADVALAALAPRS
jgi:hypothetical protein